MLEGFYFYKVGTYESLRFAAEFRTQNEPIYFTVGNLNMKNVWARPNTHTRPASVKESNNYEILNSENQNV
jgi:hypothetical protein